MLRDIRATLGVYESAMNLRVERQQVIASNIANADTPNYKAKDFDFQSALTSALSGQQTGLALTQTSAGHMNASAEIAAGTLQYRTERQSAADGNTVDMDIERSELTENSLQYEVLTRLISDKLSGLRSAISSAQS